MKRIVGRRRRRNERQEANDGHHHKQNSKRIKLAMKELQDLTSTTEDELNDMCKYHQVARSKDAIRARGQPGHDGLSGQRTAAMWLVRKVNDDDEAKESGRCGAAGGGRLSRLGDKFKRIRAHEMQPRGQTMTRTERQQTWTISLVVSFDVLCVR